MDRDNTEYTSPSGGRAGAERMREEGTRVGWIEHEGTRSLVEIIHDERVFLVIDDHEDETSALTRNGIYVGRGNSRQEAMQDLLKTLREIWEGNVLSTREEDKRELLAAAKQATAAALSEALGSEDLSGITITVSFLPSAGPDAVDDTMIPEQQEPLPPYTPPLYHLDSEIEA